MRGRRAYGTGSVYRQKKKLENGKTVELGRFWLAYYVKGKLVREPANTTSKTEAERILRERLHDIDTGRLQDPAAQRTTLSDLCDMVQQDLTANQRSCASHMGYVFGHLTGFFGKDSLARNITADQIERYKTHRLAHKAKPATVNRELAFLRRGFRLAVRRGRLAVRPDFSLLRENNARRGFITAKQMEVIRAHMPEDLRGMVTFLFYSGWRVGEALNLEWARVDRDIGVIRLETGETKSGEARTLPYGALPELVAVIEAQHKDRDALQREHGVITPFVFFRERQRVIKHRAKKASPIRQVLHIDFLEAWQKAVNAAGLPGRIPHDLRRSAARNMLQAGIPQRLAMDLGGWKTPSVFHRYGIVDESMLRDALAKLSKAR